MKRLSALAFALALVLVGCGGGGGNSSASSGDSSSMTIKTDSKGFSVETKFVDENGVVTSKISDVKSDATGEVPPSAPRVAGKEVPSSAPRVADKEVPSTIE